MAWYYSTGNQQQGPVDEAECQRLVLEGVITEDTLVWREGMTEWQPWGTVTRPSSTTSRVATAASGVTCARCNRVFAMNEVVRVGGNYICAECKPATLQQMREGVTSTGPAEEIRREHLKHEASVKSVGILYFLAAGLLFLIGVVGALNGTAESISLGLIFLLLAGAQIWVGIGLRRLKPWARIPTGILSGIGLLGFPLGTLINGYILYLVFSKKGRMVFSPKYQRVIEATPHLRYRTSIVVVVLAVILILLIGLGVIAAFIGRVTPSN